MTPYTGEVIPLQTGFTPYTGPVIPPMSEQSVAQLGDVGDITPGLTPAPAISAAVGVDDTPTDIGQAVRPAIEVGKGAISTAQELAQFPVSGIAGLAGYYGNLIETGDFDKALKGGTEEIEKYVQTQVYQPESEMAQHAKETILKPIEWWAGMANTVGTKVSELTGSPNAGAAVEVLTFLAMPEIGRKIASKAKTRKVSPQVVKGEIVEKVRQGTKPQEAIAEVVEPVKAETAPPKAPTPYEGEVVTKVNELEKLGQEGAVNRETMERTYEAMADWFDVEAKYKKIGSPETGFRVKNYFSKQARIEMEGIDIGGKLTKGVGYDTAKASDVVKLYENPKMFDAANPEHLKLKPVIDEFGKAIEDIKAEYDRRGVKLDFKERIVADLEKKIAASDPGYLTEGGLKDPTLTKMLEDAKQMNFVHIPSAMWFTEKLSRDPSFGKSLKILATQKRKNLSIQSLVEQGVIDPKDVHMADIVASYYRRAGRDFALLDIIEAAQKDGLAVKKRAGQQDAPAGYVKIPDREAPVLADYFVHPTIADFVRDITAKGEKSIATRGLTASKMMQFYNPLILPMYDTVQAVMLSGVKSYQMPKHFAKAVKDVWTRSEDYYTALDNGMASKPFNAPWNEFQRSLDHAKKTLPKEIGDILQKGWKTAYIKDAYQASWHIAWKLDETIRMMSYNYLRGQKYSPREAAQIAARFHSDYASVPIKTRRSLNKVFFTPTFKITMSKLYGSMIRNAIDPRRWKAKKGRTFGSGLLNTFAIVEAFDLLMTQGLDFERDQWGRRYKRTVDTDEGEKELVVTWSSPANMFAKYVYRFQDATKAGVEKPLKRFIELNKWEIHPVYRILYEIAENTRSDGSPVFSPFDGPLKQAGDSTIYAFRSIVNILSAFEDRPGDLEAQLKAQEEMGLVLEGLTRPFVFKYLRSTEERRTAGRLRSLQKQYKSYVRRTTRNGEAIDPRIAEQYLRLAEEVMESAEE